MIQQHIEPKKLIKSEILVQLQKQNKNQNYFLIKQANNSLTNFRKKVYDQVITKD